MIIEMRTYKTKPGMRAEFLEIFRTKSLPAHQQIGMKVLGPFLSVEDPDIFFWMRAFPSLESRGPMIPTLLLVGNKSFGFASNLRHICAACFPGKVAFFHYDWRKAGGWNLAFLGGTLVGGFIGGRLLGPGDVAISPRTWAALTALGLHDLSGLVPRR